MAKPDSAWDRVAFVSLPYYAVAPAGVDDRNRLRHLHRRTCSCSLTYATASAIALERCLVRSSDIYLVAGEDVPLVAISVLHCAFKREGSVCEWETRSQRTMYTSLFP